MNTVTVSTFVSAADLAPQMHENSLAAKIAARNRVNTLANDFAIWAREAFKSFVGKKIHLQGGSLVKKASEIMPEYNPAHFQRWHENSDYTLRFSFRCSENYQNTRERGSNHCSSEGQEQSVSIGKIENGILVSLYGPEEVAPFKTDYSAAEIIEARKKFAEYKELMEKERSKFGHFWEWDAR